MIIINNKPIARWFHYKTSGNTVKKVFIKGHSQVDISDLREESQILYNTYDQRIRNIYENFGKDLNSTFETPDDPGYPKIYISAVTSAFGTISPSGSVAVDESEDQWFTMVPSSSNIVLTAYTTSDSLGIISPSGNTINYNDHFYLKNLYVDYNDQVSAVTGNVSATTTYKVSHVLANHSIQSIFALYNDSKVFTMTPAAVGFSTTTYTLGNSGGTISPSGSTVTTNAHNYLKNFFINGSDQVSAITGNVSATTTYNLSGITAGKTVNSVFDLYAGDVNLTMEPSGGYYLKQFNINGSNQVSGVTGDVSATTTYNLSAITVSKTVTALFIANGL